MALMGDVRRFGVLGPLCIQVGGREVAVTAPRQRVVLVALLLAAGRSLSTERLVDSIWGEAPPATARVTLQNYVKRLRAGLGADCIETTAEGYRIAVTRDQLDLHQFRDHVDRARLATNAGDTGQAVECYRSALTLWRGDPLPDLQGSGWLESEISLLVDSQLQVTEEWAAAELASGGSAELVGPLTVLARRWPLRESLRALLIRALHGCGRTADGLAEYTSARTALVEELGVDPGEQLSAAHRRVLGATTIESAPRPRPAQLPAVTPWLVGRADALARLDQLIDGGEAAHALAGNRAGAIAAISGTAGVGKTSLAVHWAHHAAHRFPDGQLYVDLRGYDPTGPPMDPGEALLGFLTALGVAGQAMPSDAAARAALFRTLVATRRMLVVLDNARDAEQVRPLLPGIGGCMAVVTSRDRLTSLVAADGARPIDLDLLTPAEAVDLLRHRLGSDRVEADPGAVRALADHCARLPLALSIAAARVSHSRLSVAELAAQLTDPRRGPLELLRSGDRGTDVRDVLSWSTDALDSETARVFRLLGLHPGPDFTPEATAHLVDRDQRHTHALLDDLTRAQLLIEHRPDRYAFHDLLRAHAIELTAGHDTREDQQAAIRRLLDQLTDVAVDAHAAICPSSVFAVRPPRSRATTDGGSQVGDLFAAREWLRREDRVVAAAIRHSSKRPGFGRSTWPLVFCTGFERIGRGELTENLALHHLALTAVIRSGDGIGEAWIRLGLGSSHAYLGSFTEAERELQTAHDLARDEGDTGLHAQAHVRLTACHDRQGDIAAALRHSQAALDIYGDSDHEIAVAAAQNSLGFCLSRAGEHDRALPHCVEALAAFRRWGDRQGMAATLDSLGHIHLHLGQHLEAIGSYVEAVEVLAETGRHLQLAEVVWHLGDAYDATDDRAAAHASWQSSLDLLEQLDHPSADVLRAKLADRGLVGADGT